MNTQPHERFLVAEIYIERDFIHLKKMKICIFPKFLNYFVYISAIKYLTEEVWYPKQMTGYSVCLHKQRWNIARAPRASSMLAEEIWQIAEGFVIKKVDFLS